MLICLKHTVTITQKALYKLLDYGLRAKVSMKKFKINNKSFDYGTIMIPIQNQILNSNRNSQILSEVSVGSELNIYEVTLEHLKKVLILVQGILKLLKSPELAYWLARV